MSDWRFLGLERPRLGARFRLRDRVLSSLGLCLGVLFLVVSWGLITPAQELVRTKVLGSLPDRIRATAATVSFGPLSMGSGITQATADRAGSIAGVEAVYRQAHFPEPCQATAKYAGQSLFTDLVLEMCGEGQVAADVEDGYEFKDPGPSGEIPAIMPASILDLVNAGISINTALPQISHEAVIGKHFTLYAGTSSFKRGPARQYRCVIVGVSDQIGSGGPAIPYEAGQRISSRGPELYALTLKLRDPKDTARVVSALSPLGLRAPRLEIAERVDSVVTLLRILALLLPGAILLVTALGLTSTLELQVSRERPLIALYRALGATPRQTASLYLVRAVSVAVVGLIGGILSGLVCGRALAMFIESRLPLEMLEGVSLFAPPPSTFIWSFVFCFGVCLMAGWVPARNASKIEPAQVFREPG
jgi:ABC-type lipoprotein release transport system permease subunit